MSHDRNIRAPDEGATAVVEANNETLFPDGGSLLILGGVSEEGLNEIYGKLADAFDDVVKVGGVIFAGESLIVGDAFLEAVEFDDGLGEIFVEPRTEFNIRNAPRTDLRASDKNALSKSRNLHRAYSPRIR